MRPEVRLKLVSTADEVQECIFTEPTTCTLGRAEDCTIVVPPSVLRNDVSRHHCELRIGFHPTRALVRDLDSLNGTFVNQVKIGQRFLSDHSKGKPGQLVLLKDGDELRLGQATAYRVEIRDNSAAPPGQESPDTAAPGQREESRSGFADALVSLVKGWRKKVETL